MILGLEWSNSGANVGQNLWCKLMASKGCCGDSQPWEAGPASIQKVMRNGVKPHALKEGGWGFYEAAECYIIIDHGNC